MVTTILTLAMSCTMTVDANALGRTVAAIGMVESGWDVSAVGDGGLAVGILQIQPVLVADVNRIVGSQEFSLADRLSVSRSIQMFVIYSLHYYPRGGPEQWARAWVAGPRGPQKACSLPYWRRVQSELAKQKQP